MDFLLKNVRPIDRADGSAMDILIRDGAILQIEPTSKIKAAADGFFDAKGAFVSPGWLDVGAEIPDPGLEHRETFETAARAAVAGGFTALACHPNADPVRSSKTEILFAKRASERLPIEIWPLGAVSQGCKGQDLAEMLDMRAHGAVAFSDGTKPVFDAGLMLRALQYATAFDGLILNSPLDQSLAAGGQMHEGLVSTQLGLRGIAALAEEIAVQRDLSLVEYAGGRLLFHCISTEKSVDLIRKAKRSGLRVSASVAALNLAFTDDALIDFGSNWKTMPPLRAETDRRALWAGLEDGAIDFICSNHRPHDEEGKNLEFPFARFGAIGLETAFGLANLFRPKSLKINALAALFSTKPRQVMDIEQPKIELGAKAELTVFDAEREWVFEAKDIRSKSKNSPLIGQKLRGKALGIFSKGRFFEA